MLWCKTFAGSSTGNLLVDKEADIEKVISSSDRVVSIHSEDEDIIKLRKKFIRKGDVHSHLSGEMLSALCPPLEG